MALVVWLSLVSSRPLAHPVPYLHLPTSEAAPKCISGRTSYLRVRLAFHPYPQLIPSFCTSHGFGPSVQFNEPSPWPWVAHPVSSLLHGTMFALFGLAFATAPGQQSLNLAPRSKSPDHSSIGTPSSVAKTDSDLL